MRGFNPRWEYSRRARNFRDADGPEFARIVEERDRDLEEYLDKLDSRIKKSEDTGDGSGPHDHDYLPLEGGGITGDLFVKGTTKTNGLNAVASSEGSSATNPNIVLGTSGVNAQTGLYRNSSGKIQFACEGEQVVRMGKDTTIVYNDLQVNGRIQAYTGVTPDNPAIKFDAGTGMYRKGTHQIGFAINGVLVAYIDSGGVHGRMAFGIAEGIDTQDVLDRAEVATMPVLDDDGVETTDVETITVNEVVTALLAKVKELSARIEELEGA